MIVRKAKKVRKSPADLGNRAESFKLERPDLGLLQSNSLNLQTTQQSANSMQQRYRTPSPNGNSVKGPLVVRNPDLHQAPTSSQNSKSSLQSQEARIHVDEPKLSQTESLSISSGSNRWSWTGSLKAEGKKTKAIATHFIAGLTSDQYPILPENLLSGEAQRPSSGEGWHPLSFSRRAERLARSSGASPSTLDPGSVPDHNVNLSNIRATSDRYSPFPASQKAIQGQQLEGSLSFSQRAERLARLSDASLIPSDPGLLLDDTISLPSIQGTGNRYPPFQASQQIVQGQKSEVPNIQPVDLRTISSPGHTVHSSQPQFQMPRRTDPANSNAHAIRIPPRPRSAKYKAYRPSRQAQARAHTPNPIPFHPAPRIPSPLRIGSTSAATQQSPAQTLAARSLPLTIPSTSPPAIHPALGIAEPGHQQAFEIRKRRKGRQSTVEIKDNQLSRGKHSHDALIIMREKERRLAEERREMYDRLSQALEDWGEFEVKL